MCLHKQTSLHLYHLASQPFSSGVTPWITGSFAKGIVAFSFLVYYHLYKSPRKTALLIQHYVLESIKKEKRKKKACVKDAEVASSFLPGLETLIHQRPRQQQRQSKVHKVPWDSQEVCSPLSGGIQGGSTTSEPYSAQEWE